ncbi:zona pellucida sperm-binding protein 4-like isoform X2 [Scleropages formosus]|uniref:zona pellucida sperm-binding protein 4-like isoform X2 n=1 Tax=Scleropages formosus TaxID=113540 RepID=UPI0010FA7DF2|nr:zona pellucida sperm-binding protein 4-like isoform X2 [Scleropages formosus]
MELFGSCWWAVAFLSVVLAAFAQKMIPRDPVLDLDKCQVYDRVPCGDPAINGVQCQAIGCCFDGQQCYYGNAVTVQCTMDGQFVVVVSKDSVVPKLDLTSLSMLGGKEPPCSPVVSTDSFAIYIFPVTACGTAATVAGDYIIYENRIISSYEVGVGPLGSITRDSTYELSFHCRYLGSELVSLIADVYTIAPPPPVAAPGPLRVELRLANGQCTTKGCNEEVSAYTSYYQDSDYPVTKVLQQPVYVEVRILNRTDPNIILLLENCWATSTSDPLSLPQWSLIVNGCPYQGDKYLTTLVPVDGSSRLPFPTHYKRFIFKMFTFVHPASLHHLEERVFIHCSTAVCHPSAMENCEQKCFRRRRDIGAVQKSNADKIVVSSHEVIVTAELLKPVAMQSVAEGPKFIGYGGLAVAVSTVIGLFAFMLAVIWWLRHH